MEQMKVKDLYDLCKNEIENGNGNKYIVVSDDNEGNGYHGMFYGFTKMTKDYIGDVYDSKTYSENDMIILG